VEDTVYRTIEIQIFGNVIADETKSGISYKMCNIIRGSSDKVIENDDLVAFGKEAV